MSCRKLEIKNVTKTFPGAHSSANKGTKKGANKGTPKDGLTALQTVSLFVRDGEIVSLIGPSGCGKSTLLDVVAGLARPDGGEVLLDGRAITGQKGFVSYMPQKDVLFPWRTILDNVIIPMEVQGIKKSTARQEAAALLPVFGLEQFADNYPGALSGGMKQRAAFLRTYLCKKDLMLLDEPFGRLDALTRLQMQQWLLKIWQTFKHTVLFVTHDVEEAILLSDRIYVFSARPGRIIAEMAVAFPRPRPAGITTDPAFTAIKAELLQLLGEDAAAQVQAHV